MQRWLYHNIDLGAKKRKKKDCTLIDLINDLLRVVPL